jgi:hypothetical protein
VRFDPGHKDPVTGLNPHAVFHDNATLCSYYGTTKIPDSVCLMSHGLTTVCLVLGCSAHSVRCVLVWCLQAPASVHFQGPGILVFKFATPKGDVIAIKTFMPRGPLLSRMDVCGAGLCA